jgi:hypothetical protein
MLDTNIFTIRMTRKGPRPACGERTLTLMRCVEKDTGTPIPIQGAEHMAVKVAINGFGRIGRNVLRAIIESGRKDIEVVAINDLGPVETNAHLLRFDSVHGRFPFDVKVEGDTINVGRGPIKVTAIKDPATLPHKEMGIDVALECTGIFTSK